MHKTVAFILAGPMESSQPIPHTTGTLEGTPHSRTLYTSKALDQSNFIIIIGGLNKTGMHRKQAAPAAASETKLLPRFEIGGDQANLVDPRPAHDVDRSGHIGKSHLVITLDEGDFLSALFENVGEARPK